MAGDMTVYGVRSEVAVTREVDGVRTIEYLDLTSTDIFNSPAFYLQQNDVVYVNPTSTRRRRARSARTAISTFRWWERRFRWRHSS